MTAPFLRGGDDDASATSDDDGGGNMGVVNDDVDGDDIGGTRLPGDLFDTSNAPAGDLDADAAGIAGLAMARVRGGEIPPARELLACRPVRSRAREARPERRRSPRMGRETLRSWLQQR